MLKPSRARIAIALPFILFLFSAISWAAKQPKETKISDAECLACHADASMTEEVNGKQVSLAVDEAKFKGSAHGMFACTDCHTDIKSAPHDTPPAKPKCASCHADEDAAYNRGFHAQAVKNGHKLAATCQDCHGNVHQLLPVTDPNSKVHRKNIPATCGVCHGQKFVMEASGLTAEPFINYQQSVHGLSIAKEGDKSKAAVCTDCHGSHEILRGQQPEILDLQGQRSVHLRQVPHRSGGEVHWQHSWPGGDAWQLAGAGVHRLPWHPHHQGPQQPRFLGQRAEYLPLHLRPLP